MTFDTQEEVAPSWIVTDITLVNADHAKIPLHRATVAGRDLHAIQRLRPGIAGHLDLAVHLHL